MMSRIKIKTLGEFAIYQIETKDENGNVISVRYEVEKGGKLVGTFDSETDALNYINSVSPNAQSPSPSYGP